MKIWIRNLAIFMVVLLGAVCLVGAMLPVAHTASATRTIVGAPESVWAVLVDVQSYPEWRSDVDSVQVIGLPGARRRWIEYGSGGSIPFAAEVEAPPRRLVSRIDTDELPFSGTWTTVLEVSDQGTTVTIREDGEVTNVLFRFISRFVIGHDATILSFLDALTVRMESARSQ